MNKPYEQIKEDDCIVRTFYFNTNSEDLIWHKDKKDRYIYPLNKTNWKIQLDNELPKSIVEETFIPKEMFHRLIKGTGDLIIKIVEK